MVCADRGYRRDSRFLDDIAMSLSASVRALVGLGDAEGGTDHFWGQRVSAVALLLLGLWFVVQLATLN